MRLFVKRSNILGKVYKALFTAMGRRNFRHRLKLFNARLRSDYNGGGTLVYRLNDGRPFVFHRDNLLSELVYLDGAYEPLETLIASKTVQNDDIVLDIGANVGYYSALFDRLVQPSGEVHSFEPGNETFDRLSQTKRLLGLDRTNLHRQAIGDRIGRIGFWASTGGSDAQQSAVKATALGAQAQQYEVEVTTLDAFVAAKWKGKRPPIAFIKCDIEGAEPAMLNGAQTLLHSDNPPIWLIEHNRQALGEHGGNSSALTDPLREYEISFVPLNWPPSIMALFQAVKWNGDPAQLPDECNLIAVPRRGVYAERALILRDFRLIT
jgi:FkbM family methyltransferase